MRRKPYARARPRPLNFVLLTPPVAERRRTPQGLTGASPAADLSHFTLSANNPTSGGVIVKYTSLPGNLPKQYGNTVALWNSTIPNTQESPLVTAPVPDNSEVGDVWIPYGFQQSNYSVTYDTAGVTSMCALVQIQLAAAAVAIPTYVSLTISSLDSAGVTVIYSTLPGYTPATYKNWIGLWRGFESPYSADKPLAVAAITEDYTQGEVKIPFSPGPFDYTLIYFTGENRLTAGALLCFQATSNPADARTVSAHKAGTTRPRY